MQENDVFKQWLADEAKRVLAKLKTNQTLTQGDKLIIVLSGQMNHFHHLNVELRQEMLQLRADMQGNAGRLQEDTARLRADIQEQMTALRKDMQQNMIDLRTDMHQEVTSLRADMKQLRTDIHLDMVQFRTDMDRRLEAVNAEFRNLYQTINTQTWKMIGAVGFIVVLGKLMEQI